MFLALWNYLRGYVIIKVSGFSVERFVNLAALKGIYIWDVHPDGTGITMKVSIKGFKLLKDCSRKTKCKFKIIEKRGLPFSTNKYRKRKILGAGFVIFIIALYALSSFIWVIEIEGNQRISSQELLKSCEDMGLSAGTPKFKVDMKNITNELLENFEEISWVGIKINGTNIKINIVETIPKTEIIDKTIPCDIIAAKDGVIVNIATSLGTPMVKSKDVVAKGDLLVGGEVVLKDGDLEVSKEYVKAQATVEAKVWYNITEEIELKYSEKIYTSEIKNDISFVIGGKNINIVKPNMKENSYDTNKVFEKPFSIGDYLFPVSMIKEEYKEYFLEERERTVEEAKEELNVKIDDSIKLIVNDSSHILDKTIEFEQIGNKVLARATISVTEEIGMERKIEQGGGNIVNDTD